MFRNLKGKLGGKRDDEIKFQQIDEMDAPAGAEAAEAESATVAQNNAAASGNKMKFVRPSVPDEVHSIADYIIDGYTVVLTIDLLEEENLTRMLDFLLGVIYTQSANITRSSESTYVITPDGVDIQV